MTATAAVQIDMSDADGKDSHLDALNLETLFYMVEPMVTNIISDIAMSQHNDPHLVYVRHKLYRDFKQITGRKHIFFDTDISKTVRWLLSDGEIFCNHGYILLDAMEPWVASECTHWKADLFSPVLRILRSLDTSKSVNCETIEDVLVN